MNPPEGTVFAATLIALGLVNLGWGGIAAWRISGDAQAWRYSFVAEWGLALVGMGLLLRDGRAAAYLALLALVLVRLPLYLRARPALLQRAPGRLATANVLVALLLAGVAPFSGFPVRLLALRAATQLSWQLALVLLVLLLLSAVSSFRLARSLGHPQGREAVGLGLVLATSLALGLAPGLFLAAGGF
jgi:formate hydrogenlyase subunit 3/multisubunit Na+/H+ antiporter MnhD subunit